MFAVAGIPLHLWQAAAALPDHPTATDLDRLRRSNPQISPDQWHLIVTQTLLRRRAHSKLGPGDWLLTEAGLQQASRPVVAQRRARKLAEQGVTEWVDLGCGVGIDSIAAARAGLTVIAVERDEATAAAARHNLEVFAPHTEAAVVVADATNYPVAPAAAAFLDPARRAGHRPDGTARRSSDPDDWQPPWSWVRQFTAGHDRTVAKVAPGIDRDLAGAGTAVEWVSVAGELVEATVWFAGVRLGRSGRTATLLTPGADPWAPGAERQISGSGEPAEAGPVTAWLLEPDPAIIRAGLVGDLGELVAGHVLSPGIAYLSCPDRPDPGWGRVSRVLAELPAKPKPLRAQLRRLGVGSLEIRTRGLDLDPARLRRQLDLAPGGPAASIVVTRVSGRAAALLVSDDTVPGA